MISDICIKRAVYSTNIFKFFLVLALSTFFSSNRCFGNDDKRQTSTRSEAIAYIKKTEQLDSSKLWPGINPLWFYRNLRSNIEQPLTVYPGEGTYFCAYSAITYLMLQDDPLGYAKFVLDLFNQGVAEYRGTTYRPSPEIRKETGLLKYKGIMDINPVDQMWYLTLADHFKGYLNLFNQIYDPGDENTFWASVNYAKFNRMANKLLYTNVAAKGSDLIRPRIKDLYSHIKEKLNYGKVVLYINNRIVHKKNHVSIKLSVPTHFIVIEEITRVDDTITLIYWDNGAKTLIQLSPAFLKRIIFGVSVFSKTTDE